MFGVDSGELFVIVLIALVVIGPKDLPGVLRKVGHWVGKARGMASQFRLGIDQMMKDSDIADLEQKWREQNEAIMKAHPMSAFDSDFLGASKDIGGKDFGGKPPAPFDLEKAPAGGNHTGRLRPAPAPPVTSARVVAPRERHDRAIAAAGPSLSKAPAARASATRRAPRLAPGEPAP